MENKERFCIIKVTLRKDKENSVANLKEICKELHKHPGVKVSWMPDIEALRTREDLIKEILSYHDKYGDEVTIDLAASTILYNKQGIRKVIDEGMSKLKKSLGYYPKAVGSAHLTTDALCYLNRKYGVEIAEAFLWEQMGVDGYSTDGGINGPYYPASHHTLVLAQNEKERVNVVVLDGWTREFFETKYPYTSCMAPHPWDANVVACDGVAFMKYITDLFLKYNLVRNPFGILCLRVELDWINQTFWTYNKHQQMKARFFEWVDYMFSTYPDIHYASLTEFNRLFRLIHPSNEHLLYKYLERSKYEPNRKIYWYFCKGYRIAVEWHSHDEALPETIILPASHFRLKSEDAARQGPFGWIDGYDTADFPNIMHPTLPKEEVRSCAVDGCKDSTYFTAKGGRYNIWLLCDGTDASDIEVLIDGKLAGVASGVRGEDDWCYIGDLKISKGKHLIELSCRYNKKSEWWAIYAQALLTQEPGYIPPRKRLLESNDYIAIVSHTLYHAVPPEPKPPVNDWSVKNSGTLLKRNLPLKEVLISGNKQLNLVSQRELQQVGFHSVGLGTTVTEDRNKLQSIPFKVRLDEIDEVEEKVTFKFSISDSKGVILKKRIVLTGKEMIYEYDYQRTFDKLIITDAFSKEHTFHPVPEKVVFRKGKVNEV